MRFHLFDGSAPTPACLAWILRSLPLIPPAAPIYRAGRHLTSLLSTAAGQSSGWGKSTHPHLGSGEQPLHLFATAVRAGGNFLFGSDQNLNPFPTFLASIFIDRHLITSPGLKGCVRHDRCLTHREDGMRISFPPSLSGPRAPPSFS